MSVILSFAAVTFLAIALSIALKQRVELALPATISVLILIGWMAGYFAPLDSIRPSLWTIGVFAACYCVVRRKQFLDQASPGLAVFVALSILAYMLSRPMLLLSWDEFSHWGQVARFISVTGRFPTTGAILFDGYPFGTAIWQVLIGGDTEQNWIFAHNVLKFSGLLALFSYVGWPRPHVYLPLTVLCIVILHLFVGLGGVGDILIDAPLAIFAASALVVYFRSGRDLRSIFLSLPIAAVLPLFKDMGLILALFITGVIFTDRLVERLVHAVHWRWGTALAAMLPVAVAYGVNRIRLAALPPTEGFEFTFSLSAIRHGLQEDGFRDRFTQTFTTLRDALQHWTFAYPSHDLTTTLLAALILITIAVLVQHRRNMYAPITFAIASLVGLVSYGALLIVLYLFSFSPYEGVRLASFQRYTNTFLLIIFLMGISFVLQGKVNTIREFIRFSALIILLLFSGQGFLSQVPAIMDPSISPAFAARDSVESLVQEAPSDITYGASTYVLWNGTNGEQFYMTMYALTPYPVSRACFSLGAARHDGDVWSCDVDQRWFIDELASFDFVMIGSVDAQFIERFGDIFSVVPVRGWYSIEKDLEGNVEKVTPIASTTSPQ